MTDELTTLRTQLAACQARELRYREALELADCNCHNGLTCHRCTCLTLPSDNSELREVGLMVASAAAYSEHLTREAIVDAVIGKEICNGTI